MKYLLLVLILTQCSPAYAMSKHEKMFHLLNTIDMLQTINGPAKDPCYYEANPLTRRLIGYNPSVEGVIISSIAYSVAYHYGAKWIDRSRLPKWTKNYTFSIGIGLKANTVYQNHQRGIRPFGSNNCNW